MDATRSSLNLATHAPISGGSMSEHNEEPARCPSVAYSQQIDYDWDSIDLSAFESFCAQVLGCEEPLSDQRTHSISDQEYFIMDDELQISDSPLPYFTELGPEWQCGATAAAASDTSNEGESLPKTVLTNGHSVVNNQCLGATWNSKFDDTDRCRPSTLPLQPEPSTFYPTPPRSSSPPSTVNPAHAYAPAWQPSSVAGSSNGTSYPEAPHVSSTLAQNPYRALTLQDISTPSSFGSSSTEQRIPQSGKVPRHDGIPPRRVNPYPGMSCFVPTRFSNDELLNNFNFRMSLSGTCIQKLTAGTHLYVPMNTTKVANLAPIYDENLAPATTFFGLQRVAPPPDALHVCPHTHCFAALRIEDFSEHFHTHHSQWNNSVCCESSCPRFYMPHNPNSTHGPLCRRQIICMHGDIPTFLNREKVKDHMLAKHLKLKHIECPHCPSVLANVETMGTHLRICDGLNWARREPKVDRRSERSSRRKQDRD
ncbi:hypothetical protein IW261DRAFT_1518856, partial [Armillaria novae-zelandiae]